MPQSDSPIPAGSSACPEAPQDEAAAEAAEEAGDEPEEKATRGRFLFLTEMVVLFAVALTIALLIKTFVVQPFYIPSGSMMNTLLVGDKVLVNKLVLPTFARLTAVTLSCSTAPGSWDPPGASQPVTHNPVKRVYNDTLGALFHLDRGPVRHRRLGRRTTSNG